MKIIFVRHGDPNYANDCLTELGHKQAAAAAERLAHEKIDAFFSSSCGRARETCEYIADRHGKKSEVQILDFIREMAWGAKDENDHLYASGHPWKTATKIVEDGGNIMSENWRDEEPFVRNRVVECCNNVGRDFDKWLEELGYTREGKYYRVGVPKYKTVLLTSHGGSSSAVLSHFFGLPFSFVCYAIRQDFTAITTVTLSDESGTLAAPRFGIVNDARHIERITV